MPRQKGRNTPGLTRLKWASNTSCSQAAHVNALLIRGQGTFQVAEQVVCLAEIERHPGVIGLLCLLRPQQAQVHLQSISGSALDVLLRSAQRAGRGGESARGHTGFSAFLNSAGAASAALLRMV